MVATIVIDASNVEAIKLIKQLVKEEAGESARVLSTTPRPLVDTPRVYLISEETETTLLPLKQLQEQLFKKLPPLLERGAVQVTIATNLEM